MPITVKGHRITNVGRPASSDFRSKFIKGVDKQLNSLDQQDRMPRAWYWIMDDGQYATDIRYGNQSLLESGKGYKLKDKAALKEFYNKLKDQANAGEFDQEISAVQKQMSEKLKKGKKT